MMLGQGEPPGFSPQQLQLQQLCASSGEGIACSDLGHLQGHALCTEAGSTSREDGEQLLSLGAHLKRSALLGWLVKQTGCGFSSVGRVLTQLLGSGKENHRISQRVAAAQAHTLCCLARRVTGHFNRTGYKKC